MKPATVRMILIAQHRAAEEQIARGVSSVHGWIPKYLIEHRESIRTQMIEAGVGAYDDREEFVIPPNL